MPSAAVRVAGAVVMMRNQNDKEIRFVRGLAVMGCDGPAGLNRECRLRMLMKVVACGADRVGSPTGWGDDVYVGNVDLLDWMTT